MKRIFELIPVNKTIVDQLLAIQAITYEYTEGKATEIDKALQAPDRNINDYTNPVRIASLKHYGYSTHNNNKRKNYRCMLIDLLLPKSNVICGHLFKRGFGLPSYKVMIGEDNIDTPENTLILYKPVEWGFDTSRICFLQNEAGELVSLIN